MKFPFLLVCGVLLVGCSSTSSVDSPVKPPPSTKTTTPRKDRFGDEVFKLAPYPGSTVVSHSTMEVDSRSSHAYNREYTTPDSVDKVYKYYMTEGKKIGTPADSPHGDAGPDLQVVMITCSNGDRLEAQMAKRADGATLISLHYIIPKAGAKRGRQGGAMSAS